MESEAVHIIQRSDEVERLTKELDKCRADKEFVWGLWKKLQKNNPDLNAAIEMVVQREKANNQQRVDRLLAYGQEKETRIEELSENVLLLNGRLEEEGEEKMKIKLLNQQLSSDLNAVRDVLYTANSKLAGYEEMEREYASLKERHESSQTEHEALKQHSYSLECNHKSEVSQLTDRMRSLVLENNSLSSRAVAAESSCRDMRTQLSEFGGQLREVSEECAQRAETSQQLDELLTQQRDRLQLREVELERVRRENEEMRSQVSGCVAEGERHRLSIHETRVLVKHLEDTLTEKQDELERTNSLKQVLSNKVLEVERENSHLKEHMKELESFKTRTTQTQSCTAATQTAPDLSLCPDTSVGVLVQLLESKTLESDQMKRAHDRRLTRYKELQTAHKLLKEQLSTYAPDSILSVQRQTDVQERVLNEGVPVDTPSVVSYEAHMEVLNSYRGCQEENAVLGDTISNLEESVDELRCEKLRLETALSGLMYSVEQDRVCIISRLASLQTLSDTSASSDRSDGLDRKFSLELRIEELEECLSDLERGRKEWSNEHQKLVSEKDRLSAELIQCQLVVKRQNELICEKDAIIQMRKHCYSTKECQTEVQDPTTRSVSSQTTQHLLVKPYPPLRHAHSQTTLETTIQTPNKLNKTSHEVKSLHKRVASLSRQLDILTETRSHLKSCLEQQQERSAELDAQLTETVYKLRASRAECTSLSSELLVLKQANLSLQESVQAGLAERDSENTALFSRLEARLKSSSEECSRQAGTLYRQNRELQERRAELESLRESALRKEREHKQNLAQKRSLLEGTREQNQKMKSSVQSSEELLRRHTAEIRRLSDANTNVSNKNMLLKEQIARITEEREKACYELEQTNLALSLHTQQLNLSQTECSRKLQLLRAAKTQIDHLSDLFSGDDTAHNTDLERQLQYVTACIEEYKQCIISVSEVVWCRKYGTSVSGHKDILSLSAQEMLEVTRQGVTTATHVWTESNQYLQMVSLLEKPPPFALRLVELIIGILDM